MRLKDYIFGKRVDLISPLSPDEVAQKINAATPGLFNFAIASGVGGWCKFGRMHLDWRNPMFRNGFAPVLSARVRVNLGQTSIQGRFGASRYLQVFYSVWYAFLSLISVTLFSAWLSDDPSLQNGPLAFLVLSLLAVAPLLFHWVFNQGADRHFDSILVFLEREIQARLVAKPLARP